MYYLAGKDIEVCKSVKIYQNVFLVYYFYFTLTYYTTATHSFIIFSSSSKSRK